ncbi:MAG: MerR family transcriptional regulator [Cytophagaceae bacterium]|nr:MAG: MerR family transcriptional regulator [Cytophagaceae bacterium]
MRISELAEKAGVAASAIRYYEEMGLLEPAGRHQNGYRFYTERALQQLRTVRISQSLGFTLDEIRSFLIGEGQCDHGRVLAQIALRTDAAKAERAALDTQLERLAQLKAMLEHGVVSPACVESAVQ